MPNKPVDSLFKIPPDVLEEALSWQFRIGNGDLYRYKTRDMCLAVIRQAFKMGRLEPLLLAMEQVKLYHNGELEKLTQEDIDFILGNSGK